MKGKWLFMSNKKMAWLGVIGLVALFCIVFIANGAAGLEMSSVWVKVFIYGFTTIGIAALLIIISEFVGSKLPANSKGKNTAEDINKGSSFLMIFVGIALVFAIGIFAASTIGNKTPTTPPNNSIESTPTAAPSNQSSTVVINNPDAEWIKAVQKELGVKEDGIWGPATQKAWDLQKKKECPNATPKPNPTQAPNTPQPIANPTPVPTVAPTVVPSTEPNIGTPSVYKQTGVGKTETYTFTIKNGEQGIVAGWAVDGIDEGVYKGLGPGTYTFKVADGFYLIIDKQFGQAQWDFRLGQAQKYGWAMKHISKGPFN